MANGETKAIGPEMMALKNIDVAFLPMNLPYTMAASEAAECAKRFKPTIVYPYHYFDSDPRLFESALKGSGIEVRLRDWYVRRSRVRSRRRPDAYATYLSQVFLAT